MATTLDNALPALLKALSDPTRLRSLALLELEELSVGELSRALGMAQSRVSNHLKVLREQGLLRERHVGTSTLLQPELGASLNGDAPLAARLWTSLRSEVESLPEHTTDRMRLREVLSARRVQSADFFDRVAGEWDTIGELFQSGQARQRAVANLLPAGLVLADLGCGTGYFARALLGLCSRLICVDRSSGMLEEARGRLEPAPPGLEIDLRLGELDELPIGDEEVDGAIAGMVLHHLPALDDALTEMHRILRPGGSAVVLELAPHQNEWMHADLGDLHLGLESRDVAQAFRRAGFVDLRTEVVDDHYCPVPTADDNHGGSSASLPCYIIRGRKAPSQKN